MAVKGSQTELFYGNGTTVANTSIWTPVATILDIKPPKVEADDIETSHMQTPNQVKTFDPGWADAGELECQIQFEKVQNATLYSLFRVPRAWRMRFSDLPSPSGSKWEFENSYIKSFANEVDREQLVTADIVIKISGPPVFTQGA